MAGDLLAELSRYLQEPATAIAVLVPIVISVVLWARERAPAPRLMCSLFVLGTAMSVLCSRWVETDGMRQLHLLPSYPLFVVLASRVYRPTPSQAFALTFLSLLIADLACAAVFMLNDQGDIPVSFFYGVGGAGFGDALFRVPPGIALYLWLLRHAERHPLAHAPLIEWIRAQVPFGSRE